MNIIYQFIDKLAVAWIDYRTIKELDAIDDPFIKLEKIEISEDGFEAIGISPAIAYLAGECASMLEKNNADNYIQFDMKPKLSLKPIRVTVQWAKGESPAEQNARLREELKNINRE